jgi:hypothetical protein
MLTIQKILQILPPQVILSLALIILDTTMSLYVNHMLGPPSMTKKRSYHTCRNPTLAKCGGEAQHLEKVRIWSPPGLSNVQSSTARPKTPRIEVFLVSLERS